MQNQHVSRAIIEVKAALAEAGVTVEGKNPNGSSDWTSCRTTSVWPTSARKTDYTSKPMTVFCGTDGSLRRPVLHAYQTLKGATMRACPYCGSPTDQPFCGPGCQMADAQERDHNRLLEQEGDATEELMDWLDEETNPEQAHEG